MSPLVVLSCGLSVSMVIVSLGVAVGLARRLGKDVQQTPVEEQPQVPDLEKDLLNRLGQELNRPWGRK